MSRIFLIYMMKLKTKIPERITSQRETQSISFCSNLLGDHRNWTFCLAGTDDISMHTVYPHSVRN